MFFCNIYNHFTAVYFIGIGGFPTEAWLMFEVAVEFLLIIDVGIRVLLRNSQIYKRMWFLHEKYSHFVLFFLMLSSVPYTFIFLCYGRNLDFWGLSLIRLLKLLRLRQFDTYFTNLKIVRRFKGYLIIEFIRFLMIVLFITHLVSMSMMFIVRLEKENNETNFYNEY